MSELEQRKLAAIMFTDMVGYSALNQRDEKLAQELLEEHRRLLREIFPQFNGIEIKTIGDAFLVEFQSALEAAQCAMAIQRALAKRNADAPAERQIQVRIGVHIGDVVHRGGDVYGDGVNIASRIESLAAAGGICVSMDVERQIRNALEARFEKLAPTELKNISVPMDLFRIVMPWEQRESEIQNSKPEVSKRVVTSAPTKLAWVGVLGLAVIAFAWWFAHQPGKPTVTTNVTLPADQKTIAVLPFENLSRDPDNAFFTDGVQDQILTDLSQIADLKVISRTSVMQYKGGVPRNLREIGQQLGVAHLLEGSVQRAANRVRVNAQLIDARHDAHLWAQTYDRDLADVFAIQSEIAKAIADQLQAKLSPAEKSAIEQRPTNDVAAFDLYSRAKNLRLTTAFSAIAAKNLDEAITLLNQALQRDPSFFVAQCDLARAHDQLYALGLDHTPARLATAGAAVDAAIRLRPEAGESHLVRAQHLYYGYRDYDGALKELELARQTLPNNPEILELTGYILRRRGKSEEGLQFIQRALDVDPRNFYTLQQIALSYGGQRRYAEVTAVLDRALAVKPDDVETRATRELIALDWKADTRPLHRIIDEIRAQNPGVVQNIADVWVLCAFAERDPAGLENALRALGNNAWGDNATLLSVPLGEGLLARLEHNEEKARAAFMRAREEQQKLVQADPNFAPPICILGLIDAGLGRKKEALEEAQRALDLMPVTKDLSNGTDMLQYGAIVAAWAGEKDLACDRLAAAVSHPSVLSYGRLKLLPWWDPLRGDPRFEKIVASLAPKDAK